MFSVVERMIAFRYLRARRQEGFISVIAVFSLLGIALGVATLIIVMSVMNGFRAQFLHQILGFNGAITVYARDNSGLPNFDELVDRAKQIPRVVDAMPITEGQAVAQANGGWSGVQVRGERVADLNRQADVTAHLVEGGLGSLDDDSLLIGARLAATLHLALGDTLTLLSPQGMSTPFGTVPRTKSYRIAGIFDTGMYQYDSGFVLTTLKAAQLFFHVPDAATAIQIFADDPEHAQDLIGPLYTAMGDSTRIYDWQGSNSPFLNAVKTERNVMFLILTLIILVAAFNVISSMIMLVRAKGRDIAILRTMGATRGMILRIFFLTGASIGVVGTLTGLLLGVAFSKNIENIRRFLEHFTGTDLFSPEIYFLSQLPSKIDTFEVLLVVAIAFTLSFLATIYPAWRAARLDPVEALRYE